MRVCGVDVLLERDYQRGLIHRIRERLPDCIVFKNDPNYKQGVPDLTVFYNDRWATLEVKKSSRASKRPNQDYYVNQMNEMSFSAFIYSENEEETLDAMERSLLAKR